MYYRAARFQDLVNISQQVHLYNQRVVTGLITTGKSIQIEKIDPKQINPSLLGPLPLPVRKIPFRLNEIPFFDTTYMCDPINNYGITSAIFNDNEEPWDLPLQKNPSLTNYLMTYNAFKKEQACQTNWDRVHESDLVYNQSYTRDSNLFKRSSIEPIRNEYSSQDYMRHSQTTYRPGVTSSSYGDNTRDNYTSAGGLNSRRNSLKKRLAPTPPPIIGIKIDSQTNTNNSYKKPDFRPHNPVKELEMMGRRTSIDSNTSDNPPFNFKAMLRKTNYTKPEPNNNQTITTSNNITPKLKPTQLHYNNRGKDENFNRKSTPITTSIGDTKSSTFKEAGTYIEEEIAPGITLSGYALNI